MTFSVFFHVTTLFYNCESVECSMIQGLAQCNDNSPRNAEMTLPKRMSIDP
jgi:hypothetical protein